ncbi:MAG: M23 family metallopeptidase [Acidimicrobiia bacterium]
MLKRLLLTLVLVALVPVPAALAQTEDFTLIFPQDATVTEFTSSWGHARSGHRHHGNDLMAPKMTPVYAAADGVVLWIRDRGTAGRYVTLEHRDGWETWYMHLNDDNPGTDDSSAPLDLGVAVEVGDVVAAGDLIGWVGDSGNAEGSSPHNHFELHHNGGAIDPYPYLMPAFEQAMRDALTPEDIRIVIR